MALKVGQVYQLKTRKVWIDKQTQVCQLKTIKLLIRIEEQTQLRQLKTRKDGIEKQAQLRQLKTRKVWIEKQTQHRQLKTRKVGVDKQTRLQRCIANIASVDRLLTTIGNPRQRWLILSKTSQKNRSGWSSRHNRNDCDGDLENHHILRIVVREGCKKKKARFHSLLL